MVIGNAAFELDPNDYRLFLCIKDAAFELDPDSSPGPNEYTSAFFSACSEYCGIRRDRRGNTIFSRFLLIAEFKFQLYCPFT